MLKRPHMTTQGWPNSWSLDFKKTDFIGTPRIFSLSTKCWNRFATAVSVHGRRQVSFPENRATISKPTGGLLRIRR